MAQSSLARALLLALVFAGLALVATAPSAFAANIIVNISVDEDTANGDCSLREAITAANTDAAYNGCTAGSGADTISFHIPGAALSTRTIAPLNALGNLPNIITPLTIDGWSQGVFDGTAGYNAAPLIELSGANGPTGVTNAGLAVLGTSANGVLIRGLIVNRFTGSNTNGILIDGGASNVTLHGNYVGLNADGTAAASNDRFGINVTGVATSNVTIGGTSPEHRNVVSGTTAAGFGINIDLTGNNITVQGNYIGTNAAGTAAVPNVFGIAATSFGSNVVVGGTAPGARNIISGNTGTQIGVARNALIQGNWIGTDATGTSLIPSGGWGIELGNAQLNVTIGGTTAAARNVVVGMTSSGIDATFNGSAPSSVTIQGNYVGVMPDGTTPGGNGGDGILIRGNVPLTVGGTAPGAGNLIANNAGDGVSVQNAGTFALIRGNRIFNNGTTANHLGIELQGDGITANDTGDGDTGGNTLLNFPVLTSAGLHAGATRVTGTLNSTVNTSFEIDLYANASCSVSGNGQGETYLGSTSVTTDISGNGAFTILNLPATTLGQFITATTSNTTTGATSEFSACRTVVAPSIGVTPTSGLTTTEAGGTATFNVQLAVVPSSVVTIGVSSSDLTEGGVSTATLTFQPDATGVVAQTVTLTGVDDLIQDGNVAYTAILAAATSADGAYSGVNPTDVSATNQDNEGTPALSIANVQQAEGASGSAAMTFTVSLTPGSLQTITVQYATSDNTATSGISCGVGVDYVPASGALTFSPTETSKQIPVTMCGDLLSEPDETFTVTLSNPTNALLGQATATGTIQDDDVTQTVSVGTPQLTLNADGTGTATIPVNVATSNLTSAAVAASAAGRPSAAAAQTVTVSYTTQDGTAKANVDYLPISGTLTFAPGDSQKTVAVTVLPVGLASPSGIEFRLVLTSTTNGVIAPGQDQATVLLPADTRAVKPSTDDTDKPRRLTEEQRQQRQQTNRSNRDDTHTEGNVLEVGTDANGAYLILANRDGPVTVRLHGDAAKTTVKVGDYVQVEGTKESEALFIADEVSVSR
ncbi:MAG: CSLREA domain-containing protein [Chloroflexi bacterium]|nr:CSLREA domain-containing protein [Chloroflexota bacterium]